MVEIKPTKSVTAKNISSTDRIYARVQSAFADWCSKENISNPGHEHVARYLAICAAIRGPSSVPVHLSAIADLFRSQGHTLDTKSEMIQAVVAPIRRAMKT